MEQVDDGGYDDESTESGGAGGIGNLGTARTSVDGDATLAGGGWRIGRLAGGWPRTASRLALAASCSAGGGVCAGGGVGVARAPAF